MQSNNNSTLENRGWEGMKDLLDEQMPVRGFGLGWLYVMIGVLALLMAGYFFTQKESVQLEDKSATAQEAPVAMHEQALEEEGGQVGAENGQARVRKSATGVVEMDQRQESSMSVGRREAVRDDGVAIEMDAEQRVRQDAGYDTDASEWVIVARREVGDSRTEVGENVGIYNKTPFKMVPPVATLPIPKLDFFHESMPLNEISFLMRKRNAFKVDGQIQAGLLSFPGHPFSGVEMGIGAIIQKGDSPWSLHIDVGFGRIVHDATAFGFALHEADLINSGGGVPTGSRGELNDFSSGSDPGIIDPDRLDIVMDAITAWDRLYGRLTVSRHIHGGLRLGVGMALQYVSDVSHNSVVYYEDTDDAGMIEQQYLELEERSLSQLGWIRTYIPSAMVEIEYRLDPNWSFVGRYEQDLAGIVRSNKSSLPYYESDSRLGVGLKWRFN